METSEQVNELFASLAIAQGEFDTVKKSAENTFFKKPDGKGAAYATLADCVKATHTALSKNKLCMIQGVHGGEFVARLAHASGQWIQVRIPIPGDISKMNAQQLGSATTYLRRQTYSLVGLAPDEDDDGNEAAKVGNFQNAVKPGIGVHSPLGDTDVTDQDRLYASVFMASVKNGETQKVRETHADLHEEGEERYRAVWSLLDSKTRSSIKKILEKEVTA